MKGKDIFNAFTKIDEEYIEESERFCSDEKMIYEAMKGRTHRRAAAIAVILCVAVIVVVVVKPIISNEKTPVNELADSNRKDPNLLSYEDILKLEYGGGAMVDGSPFEGSYKVPHSAVIYKVIKAHYYIGKRNGYFENWCNGFRTYEIEITKVNKKINGLNLKVGDRIIILFGSSTHIVFKNYAEYIEAIKKEEDTVIFLGKEYYEFKLYKKYGFKINTDYSLNMEGNIFLNEGEEYAAYLYKNKIEGYFTSYATYPLNNAEEVMRAHETIYRRGNVKVKIGERMIKIANGEEEDILAEDEYYDVLKVKDIWELDNISTDNKADTEKLSDKRYDMLDSIRTDDGRNEYTLAIVNVLNPEYYISEHNKIICIYEVVPGWLDDKYNTIGLNAQNTISHESSVKATVPSTYLRLKDESKLPEIIRKSIGTLTIGEETYYKIYLEKQYEYELVQDADGAIILSSSQYAVELNTCDAILNDKGIYQIEYAFPCNSSKKEYWEENWADHKGTGIRWEGGKMIAELIVGETKPEALKR